MELYRRVLLLNPAKFWVGVRKQTNGEGNATNPAMLALIIERSNHDLKTSSRSDLPLVVYPRFGHVRKPR